MTVSHSVNGTPVAKTITENRAAFLHRAVERKAWRYGDFTLKSGRRSDFFFDIGRLCQGGDLTLVGRAFAAELLSLESAGSPVDALFGPAYKGIPLVAATAQILATSHDRDLAWSYDRKQEKGHGEGGQLVGADLKDRRVVIIDDVLTAGTATRQAATRLRDAGAKVVALLVALDREEPGPNGSLARKELVDEGWVNTVVSIARRSDFEGLDSSLVASA